MAGAGRQAGEEGDSPPPHHHRRASLSGKSAAATINFLLARLGFGFGGCQGRCPPSALEGGPWTARWWWWWEGATETSGEGAASRAVEEGGRGGLAAGASWCRFGKARFVGGGLRG